MLFFSENPDVNDLGLPVQVKTSTSTWHIKPYSAGEYPRPVPVPVSAGGPVPVRYGPYPYPYPYPRPDTRRRPGVLGAVEPTGTD